MKDLKGGRIIDLIPECLRSDPRVTAFSDAFGWMTDLITDLAANEIIYPAIDKQDADVLDFLAIVLRTQQYDQSYSLTNKRELIKGTFKWYMHAGTVQSVQELCTAVFGGTSSVEEWFDMNPVGDAFTFNVVTSSTYNENMAEQFDASITNVKNVRSKLLKVRIQRSNNMNIYNGITSDKLLSKHQAKCDLTVYE